MKRKIIVLTAGLLLSFAVWAGLESVTYISDLNISWPLGTDHFSTTDDHLRNLKKAVKNSFPNITGAMTKTQAELNALPAAADIWTGTNDGIGSGLNADLLDDQSSAFYRDATNLNAGTLASARLSGTYSSALTFSSASNAFTGSGSGLTALNASNLSSGTVADARISSSSVTQHMDDGHARNISSPAKAGVAKTLSSSGPSGGSDGDIWYKY